MATMWHEFMILPWPCYDSKWPEALIAWSDFWGQPGRLWLSVRATACSWCEFIRVVYRYRTCNVCPFSGSHGSHVHIFCFKFCTKICWILEMLASRLCCSHPLFYGYNDGCRLTMPIDFMVDVFCHISNLSQNMPWSLANPLILSSTPHAFLKVMAKAMSWIQQMLCFQSADKCTKLIFWHHCPFIVHAYKDWDGNSQW